MSSAVVAPAPLPSIDAPARSERLSAAEEVRVLRIIARLNIGGPAGHVTLLTAQLDPERYRSALVAGDAAPCEGDYLAHTPRSIEDLRRIPALGRAIRGSQDLRALITLVRLMRAYRPHIVHTHTAKAGGLGRLAAWWCGVPVIVHTYHGHVFRGYFSAAMTRLFVMIDRWLARRTDCLVAVTDRVRQELLDLGIGRPDRFEVIPPGVDLTPFLTAEQHRGRLQQELGLPAAACTVGIVARLVPIKAHETFLRAAKLVLDRLPDTWFLVVGDGERRAMLEAMAGELGIAARTRFLGWRTDLDRVYAGLDVVTLTSRNEGSPVALIEAMAAGRPVVSTDVGGVADVVRHEETGLLVEPGNDRALADAIVRLLADHLLAARLARAGREHVERRHHADRLIAEIDRLYGRLLEEARTSHSAGAARTEAPRPPA